MIPSGAAYSAAWVSGFCCRMPRRATLALVRNRIPSSWRRIRSLFMCIPSSHARRSAVAGWHLIDELNLFAFNSAYGVLVSTLSNVNLMLSAYDLSSSTMRMDITANDFINVKQRLEILNKIHNNFSILMKDKNYPKIFRIDIQNIDHNISFGFILFSSVSIATLLTFLLFYFTEAFKNQRN